MAVVKVVKTPVVPHITPFGPLVNRFTTLTAAQQTTVVASLGVTRFGDNLSDIATLDRVMAAIRDRGHSVDLENTLQIFNK